MNILQWLANELMLSEKDIYDFIKSCPHRYKKYNIKKRNEKGSRRIAQPAKQVKNLQQVVYQNFFSDLPIHDSATAYRKGRGIKTNALAHRKNQYLLKMDFSDFFPSIRPEDFIKHIQEHSEAELTDVDKSIIARLFFYVPARGRPLVLSIGSPTSPAISNTVLYNLDIRISEFCKNNSIVYTRYADDTTFSTNTKEILFQIPELITNYLQELPYPSIKLNEQKTVFTSKKFNRHVTGLVITNDNKISIGRDKKRKIKSLIHKHINGNLEEEMGAYLQGYLSFIHDVEPEFIFSLKEKYGHEVIKKIMSGDFN